MRSRLLLDTCAILYMTREVPLEDDAVAALDEASDRGEAVSVSPISAWEIGLLAERGRLSIAASPARFFHEFMALPGMRLESLSPLILIESSFLPTPVHRDPADRVIIATARALDLTVVTRDRDILEYSAKGHVRALAC
jgi:PIN domain nuclease of toxin-antitoxin system